MRALLVAALLLGPGLASQAPPAPDARIAETIANVQGVQIAGGTAADLALHEEYLRRVADRILRTSFESRFRAVVEGGPTSSAATPDAEQRSFGQRALDVLALLALVVVLVLGFFAWRAWARKRP